MKSFSHYIHINQGLYYLFILDALENLKTI